jgi:Vault protein inter-alpha-trypsin domain
MRISLLLALTSLAAFAEAPVSLTSSDGTGLKLVRLQARGVVTDPLAFTELTLTFENPLDRVLEGQFKVTLPPGATVSRFAMKLDGRWQEGEVVERQAARRAYEDFLHRRQDPALLEQSGGNEFTAKVFPIPARGLKEVVISYSHDLVQRTADYVIPLKGLPEVGELDVTVSGVTGEGTLSKKRFVPNADFVAAPKRRGRCVDELHAARRFQRQPGARVAR